MNLPSMSVLGAVWGASEFLFALKSHSKSGAKSKDRRSLSLIWIVCVAGISLGIYFANTQHSFEFPSHKIFYVAGYWLFVSGLVFRWYSIIYLGRFFTPDVAVVKDHRLIDSGPYRFIRHPTYTGILIVLSGLGLSLDNAASALVIILPVLAVLLWRIRIEEAALIEAFGDQYRNYMQRTKRLIPLIY